jgi:hypothetical protein
MSITLLALILDMVIVKISLPQAGVTLHSVLGAAPLSPQILIARSIKTSSRDRKCA